jgi:transcriptional regulator with XRE-family HTH domain
MPAKAPATGEAVAARLAALGGRIRAWRKRQRVAATTTAEAAGMSRATLQRIERGEPSVTMGAYLSAIDALGLQFEVTEPGAPAGHAARVGQAKLPPQIHLADYPQLQSLAWQLHGVSVLQPADALNLYERNWRHIDQGSLRADERALIDALVTMHGGGRLLV